MHRIPRLSRTLAATATAALMLSAGPAATATTGSGTRAAMFGGNRYTAQLFSSQGHPVAITRVYDHMGDKFGASWLPPLMAQGTTALASLDLNNGQDYAQVAAGADDKQVLAWLQGAEAAAVRYHLGSLWVSFQHEANIANQGSPASFIAAWDRIHALAAANHFNWQQGGRLHWVMILTARAYWPASACQQYCGTAASFFPGASEADAVAADGYNTMGCHHGTLKPAITPAITPTALFGPALAFASAHGRLPVIIAEFGSFNPASAPSAQPGFISAMHAYVAGNPQIIATSYWDQAVPAPGRCDYSPVGNPASMTALDSMQKALTGRP